MTDSIEAKENQLRNAGVQLDEEAVEFNVAPITRKANQDLAFRDAITFSFTRFLTTVITLFSGMHRYLNKTNKEQRKNGQT